jgi:glycosyltransferase involved in cell wall biosynthesis
MIANNQQGTVVHFVANIGGGVWSVAKTLAAYHRRRWRVLLVGIYKGPLRASHAAEAKACFDRAHLIRRPRLTGIFYLAPVNVRSTIKNLGVDPNADDVVYVFHTGPFTPLVFRLPRRLSGGTWLSCFHGSRGNFHDVNNYAKRWLHARGVKSMLKKGITLIAVSHRSARDCAEMYGCRAEDFQVIHNGTHPQNGIIRTAPSVADRPFRIGFLGTVMPIKGWRKVVEAARQLRREGLQVMCSVFGDGPDFPQLQQLAAQHSDWLEAPGHVIRPEQQALPSLDVLVVPSDFEGHPEVILEAMACGVPCICSDVGGCAETVRPEREGYILRHNTADEIAACIRRIMHTDGLWTKMSQSCTQRHRELFTAERMADSWEQLYVKAP